MKPSFFLKLAVMARKELSITKFPYWLIAILSWVGIPSAPTYAASLTTFPLEFYTENAYFYCLDDIQPDKKVIILVHGWSITKTFDSSLAKTRAYYETDWQSFIEHFQNDNVCLHTWDVKKGIPYLDKNPLTNRLIELHSAHKIPYGNINIIAHSHGGNYAKDAFVQLYQQEQTKAVHNIELITIATPHTGSEQLYLRNVLKSAEILGYTTMGILYGAWLHSLYDNYQNASTEAEKEKYQIMLGIFGTLGVIGAVFIGQRMQKFDEIYNYPGLLQLRPIYDNPVLTHINTKIQEYQLSQSISAIYSDYSFSNGDSVVPVESASWEGEPLKFRQLMPSRTHLGLMAGDAEVFTCIDKLLQK